ncbi:MAG: response regulator transcription factor [Kiritimatiellae bacterium]|nr:response regulator transcription factor [Kiritimatiellia bacterium]
MRNNCILVVEDDSSIRTVLGLALKSAGYPEVEFAVTGNEALSKALSNPPRLVLLDLMLPGMGGIETCRELRLHMATRETPIIMLTALADERDIVKGFEAGADDYVTKPFQPSVLMARIKALLRRSGDVAWSGLDGLVLDESGHVARLDGAELSLTPTEYGILRLMLRHPGMVYTRAQIIEAVQGCDKAVTDRTVDVQLVGLRRKLGAWSDHIEAVRGVGYRLKPAKG